MPTYTVSVAAATAVLNADLLADTIYKRSPYARTLNSVAMTGSAAAGDTAVDLFIDEVRVASIVNSATGFPQQDAATIFVGSLGIPAGAAITATVTDAAASSPIHLQTSFTNLN